jgi:hypothetical protein
MRFNVWLQTPKKNDTSVSRWTIAGGNDPENPNRLTYVEAARLMASISNDRHPVIREVLTDGSPGNVFTQNPTCHQCGELHP